MDPSRPFLLVRARPKPEAWERFEPWFRDTHLADAAKIPGIREVQSGVTPGGTRLGFYTFESADAVQAALSSPEAAYARGTWEGWAGELEELGIEIWAPLFPLPIYQASS
ncbi:MAG: hypothetical protein LC118_10125 [Dehalococcoidia bacterium]|nr:hypothetical protein [Dehalococcoidia bacterium]